MPPGTAGRYTTSHASPPAYLLPNRTDDVDQPQEFPRGERARIFQHHHLQHEHGHNSYVHEHIESEPHGRHTKEGRCLAADAGEKELQTREVGPAASNTEGIRFRGDGVDIGDYLFPADVKKQGFSSGGALSAEAHSQNSCERLAGQSTTALQAGEVKCAPHPCLRLGEETSCLGESAHPPCSM